jgi:hypothetical protein
MQKKTWWLFIWLHTACGWSGGCLSGGTGVTVVWGAYEVEEVTTVCFLPCSLRQNMLNLYAKETIVLQGGLTSHFLWNGGDAMKNQNNFDFKDLLSFGTFLLALLTFIFLFCK